MADRRQQVSAAAAASSPSSSQAATKPTMVRILRGRRMLLRAAERCGMKSSTAIEMLVLASLPTNEPRSRITPTWNSSAPGLSVAFRATAPEWAKSNSKRMAPGGAFSITGLPAENLRRLHRLCKTTMVKNSRSLSCI
uniref:Uncharacterized protein n=1 Tax=Oryza punctata TaxID=4537 RepID=A0A0E0M1H0_ORYPU